MEVKDIASRQKAQRYEYDIPRSFSITINELAVRTHYAFEFLI